MILGVIWIADVPKAADASEGPMTHKLTPTGRALVFVVLALGATAMRSASAQVPGRCEIPASQRATENGCYVSATVVLGELPPGPLFWHLLTYPDRAAAKAASGPRAVIVEAFGKVWLYAIAEQRWRPPDGEYVIALGPLELHQGGGTRRIMSRLYFRQA